LPVLGLLAGNNGSQFRANAYFGSPHNDGKQVRR
jgi:hypothetical protein